MRRGLAAGLLTAVLAVLAAQPAAAAPSQLWGLSLLAPTLPDGDLTKMTGGGVTNVRFSLFWQNVEAQRGQFKWALYDQLIGQLASHGIEPLPALDGTPAWISSTRETPPVYTRGQRDAWTDFVSKAVQRYGPNGEYWTNPLLYRLQFGLTAPILPVHSWEVWNEPTFPDRFAPKPSVKRYAQLLRISHAAITHADPTAKIVLAGLFGYAYKPRFYAWRFLDKLYDKPKMKSRFDAVALHPYSPNMRYMVDQISKTRKAMAQNGDRHTPLWVNEIGWGSAKSHDRLGLNKGKKGQSRMLKKAFRLLRRKRGHWHIQHVDWFTWRDPGHYTGKCKFCPHAGLLNRSGHPKPAWRAYRGATR